MDLPRRRLSVMPQPDGPSNGRLLSGIPAPTTAKKPNSMRMSMANPSALRTPYANAGHSHPYNPRQSLARPPPTNPLLMSVSKQPQNGRTPLNASARRTSMWPGAAAQPQAAGALVKDPRPIRDKAHQQKMRTDIVLYLQQAGMDVVPQTLTNIQAKDFRSIFNWLIGILDPDFPFDPDLDYSVKFDEKERKDAQARGRETEFLDAIAAVRYPFASSIDKKWIASPGAQYSWPVLLALLHWLVELCKKRDEYFNISDATTQNTANIPDEFEDPLEHHALAFEFFEEAYLQWLDDIDDPVEARVKLEQKYARKSEGIQADLDAKLEELSKLDKEYKSLKSSPAPIVKLEEENQLLKRDSEKFELIFQSLGTKRDKMLEFVKRETAELEARGQRLEEMKQEQLRIAEIVKVQNLSVQEVEDMRRDHESLTRQLQDLEQKGKEAHRMAMSLEVILTNRAGETEESIDTYMDLLSNLRLLPNPPPPWENAQLALELRGAAEDPTEMLAGSSISGVIKPTLSSISEAKRREKAEKEDERIRLENELDKLTAECENLEDELAVVEKQAASINTQADNLREASQQETSAVSQEASRLEKEIASARNAALATGMGVKTRLQTLTIEYREQVEKVVRLKEKLVKDVVESGNDIASFKDDVSGYLTELKDFAQGI